MKYGWIVWVIMIAVLVVAWYLVTGFGGIVHNTKTTYSVTTVPTSASTTVPLTTINYTSSHGDCSNFTITGDQPSYLTNGICTSSGGLFGIWAASGDSGAATLSISSGNVVFLHKSFDYNCMEFFENITLPSNTYTVNLTTGQGGGSCGPAIVTINRSTTPPQKIYTYIYNSNFSNGEYTGWKASTDSFGQEPFNITYADNKTCYLGTKWSNYVGDFFATNFDCGLATQPGNLTSSYFRVDPRTPYLNFKIISPQDDQIYIEILAQEQHYQNQSAGFNMTPVIVAHFNTYNITANPNAPSTFMNATIPLTQYANKVVEVRIVALSLKRFAYIAIGDFNMSGTPNMQDGIGYNISQVS
jgi:hypothetical protein